MIFTDQSKVTLVQCMASDNMVAMSAWVSTNLNNEEKLEDRVRVEKLINFLLKNKHMSPFEHGQFTFKIETPIFVAREFMRHRTFSYNEMSGRYTDLKPKFYAPNENRPLIQIGKPGAYTFETGTEKQYLAARKWTLRAYWLSWLMYRCMIRVGIAREVARNVLPVGIFTEFYATVNPRNLMQFLDLRNDQHALYEIRAVAQKMELILEEQMPLTYKAYKENK